MNHVLSFLNIYLMVNILLAASGLIFIYGRRLLSFLNIRVDSRQFVKLAQIAVVVSILSPVFFNAIPDAYVPGINLGVLHKVSMVESAGFKRVFTDAGSSATAETASKNTKAAFALTEQWPYIVLYLLLSGGVFFLGRFLINILNIRKILLNSSVIRNYRRTHVAISDAISIPFSVRHQGIKWVVLPEDVVSNRSYMDFIIRHELQHHRQGDTVWAIIMELLIGFFYVNPVIYLWKKEIIELQEFSCDEELIRRRNVPSYDYGLCLLNVAEGGLTNRRIYAGTTCMASALRRRIEMLPYYNKLSASKWTGYIFGLFIVLFAMTVACSQTTGKKSDNTDMYAVNIPITDKSHFEEMQNSNYYCCKVCHDNHYKFVTNYVGDKFFCGCTSDLAGRDDSDRCIPHDEYTVTVPITDTKKFKEMETSNEYCCNVCHKNNYKFRTNYVGNKYVCGCSSNEKEDDSTKCGIFDKFLVKVPVTDTSHFEEMGISNEYCCSICHKNNYKFRTNMGGEKFFCACSSDKNEDDSNKCEGMPKVDKHMVILPVNDTRHANEMRTSNKYCCDVCHRNNYKYRVSIVGDRIACGCSNDKTEDDSQKCE